MHVPVSDVDAVEMNVSCPCDESLMSAAVLSQAGAMLPISLTCRKKQGGLLGGRKGGVKMG